MRQPTELHPMPHEAVRESRDLFARWLADVAISTSDAAWVYRASKLTGFSTYHLTNIATGRLTMSPRMRQHLNDVRARVERHAREMATLVAQ